MKDIQIFNHEQFGTVRTITDEKGQTFFVGKDVAQALGYSNTRDALSKHVDHEDKTTVAICDGGSNYKSRAVIVNESGLYSLVLRSQLPQARAFKRWVTSEVLPQIRRSGRYEKQFCPQQQLPRQQLCQQQVPAALPSPKQILDMADKIIAEGLRMLNEDAEDTLTATQVAKTFNMSVFDFNAVLRDMGIQYRRRGRWHISDDLADRNFVRLRTHVSYSLMGEKKVRTYMTWTLQGLRYLNSRLGYPNF